MSAPVHRWHTHLLGKLLDISPDQVPWQVALRNTAGIVLPLVAGLLSGHLHAGLGMATGALTVMFSDQPGPYGLRLKRMLLATAAGALAALAGFSLGTQLAAFLPLVAIWSLFAALLVALGPAASRVGLTSIIVLLITSSRAGHTAIMGATLLILSGGLLQSLLAVMAWPLNRYKPQREALADAFAALASSARRAPTLCSVPAQADTINHLQAMLILQDMPRSRAQETFCILTSEFDLMRLQLIALEEYQQHLPAREAGAVRDLRRAAARVLYAISSMLHHAGTSAAYSRQLQDFNAVLEAMRERAASMPDNAGLQAAVERSTALAQHLRAALRNADFAGSAGDLRADAAARHLPSILRPAQPMAILRANMRLHSVAFRHALRCSIVVTFGLALAHLSAMQHAYWLPMTAAIVLKPDFGATITQGLLRMAGTLTGLLVLTLLLYSVVPDVGLRIVLLAILCFTFRKMAPRHYGIGVAALSGMLVLMLALAGEPAMQMVSARAIGTIGGSMLALTAYLLWPSWERSRVKPALADMLEAWAAYLLSLTNDDPTAHSDTRSAARATRSNAQASLERLRQEPRTGEGLLDSGESLLVIGNRLARASMMLDALLINHPELRHYAELTDLLQAVAGRTTALSASLRDGHRAPDPGASTAAAQSLRSTLRMQNDKTDLMPIIDRLQAILATLEAVVTAKPGLR